MQERTSQLRTLRIGAVALAIIVLPWVMPEPARAQAQPGQTTPPAATQEAGPPLFENWRVRFETGGRTYDLYGDRPGKFLEHRDVTKGFYVRGAGLDYVSDQSPLSFSFKASDVRELDERVSVDISRVGRWKTTFLWDRIPRYYSDGTSLFHAV